MTVWISAGQQSNTKSVARHRRYRPDFEFWQRLIKERQENVIHATLERVSRQWVGSKFVCSDGTTIDWTTIKGAVFCNFDLTHLSCCFQPPPTPNILSDVGSLKGRVQNLVLFVIVLSSSRKFRSGTKTNSRLIYTPLCHCAL